MNTFKTAYAEKLKDPRWQKKRLEILNRDEFKCAHCTDDKITLHVHHIEYKKGCDPWDYPNDNFLTLCTICHNIWHMRKTELEKTLIPVAQYAQQYLKLDILYMRRLRDTIYENLKDNQ
jgi:5-methylcytosine-specific restriction endonuclease McrA